MLCYYSSYRTKIENLNTLQSFPFLSKTLAYHTHVQHRRRITNPRFVTRLAQVNRLLLSTDLYVLQMLTRLTPLAADRAKQMPVLHAATTVEPIVHMIRIVLHEIATLGTYRILMSVKLKHVPDQRDLLQLYRCTQVIHLLFALLLCRLARFFLAGVQRHLPRVGLCMPLLVYLIAPLATVHLSGIIVYEHPRLTIGIYVMHFLCRAMRHKPLELLTLHADQSRSDRRVHLLAVRYVMHLPQRLDLPHSNMRRKCEHSHVNLSVVRPCQSTHGLKLVPDQLPYKRAQSASRSSRIVRLLKGLQLRDCPSRNLEQLNHAMGILSRGTRISMSYISVKCS